jgi:hypothetical protein
MSYLGSTPTTQNFIAGTDSFNGTGSATNFTLSRFVNSVNDVQVVVNNVVQYPPNYSVSGNTLTISPAPSAGTNNVYVRYLSTTLQSVAPVAGSTQQFASGTAANPSITFLNDTNTGVYSPAADTIAFVEGGVEAMRIDSSANVGIGTSSPGARLDVSGSVRSTNAGNENYFLSDGSTRSSIQQSSNAVYVNINDNSATQGAFIWRSSSSLTERARIDSSGNLLVGATSQPIGGVTTRLSVSYATSDYSFGIRSTAGTPYGIIINYSTTPNNTGSEAIYFSDSTGGRFAVRSNGGIANYQANNANLSDRREKTNFAPAGEYLSKICAIPVQTFNYIDQNLEEDSGLTLGVVAQDVQAVAPELVSESNWGTQEEPKVRLSIYQTDMQYALMKCIQEQQAMIDTMKQEIAELKAKVGE